MVKRASYKCRFCGVAGHNVATCVAAPCNWCGLIGHIGRSCPDRSKGPNCKKGNRGEKGQVKVEELMAIAKDGGDGREWGGDTVVDRHDFRES